MKFSNLSGTQLVATRSIQSTQKKNSITQKTLESVLMYKDPSTGEVNNILLFYYFYKRNINENKYNWKIEMKSNSFN